MLLTFSFSKHIFGRSGQRFLTLCFAYLCDDSSMQIKNNAAQ